MTEADYRERLVAAEAKLEAADVEYKRLMALQQDVPAINPDGTQALRQAIRVKRAALTEYGEAMREFTEFVFQVKSVPETGR